MVNKKLNKKKLVIFILMLIVIILLILGGVIFNYLSPKNKNGKLIDYEVSMGTSVYGVFEDLEEKDIIKSALFMKLYSKTKKDITIDAGTYKISSSMSLPKLLDVLTERNVVNKEEVSFTFKEGRNIINLVDDLSSLVKTPKEEMLETLNNEEFINELIDKYWFLTDEIKNEDIYYSLEGYLYPNTYKIFKDGDFKSVVYKMLDETENKLNSIKSDIEKSGYSIHEIITLASVVEQEGAIGSDRKGIAGVFVNRLNNGWSLGSCVTTYYGSKVQMGDRDLYQYEIDDCTNKYNTRCKTHTGLPVGPICNPSIESIEASLFPTKHEYYYFVSDKSNNTYFSKDYSEHLNTISRLQSEGLWYEY